MSDFKNLFTLFQFGFLLVFSACNPQKENRNSEDKTIVRLKNDSNPLKKDQKTMGDPVSVKAIYALGDQEIWIYSPEKKPKNVLVALLEEEVVKDKRYLADLTDSFSVINISVLDEYTFQMQDSIFSCRTDDKGMYYAGTCKHTLRTIKFQAKEDKLVSDTISEKTIRSNFVPDFPILSIEKA